VKICSDKYLCYSFITLACYLLASRDCKYLLYVMHHLNVFLLVSNTLDTFVFWDACLHLFYGSMTYAVQVEYCCIYLFSMD
jgi:hypothetical protein